jgi:hypothetical protein
MVYDDRMSDYIEVKDRIQAFHNKYPDGSHCNQNTTY